MYYALMHKWRMAGMAAFRKPLDSLFYSRIILYALHIILAQIYKLDIRDSIIEVRTVIILLPSLLTVRLGEVNARPWVDSTLTNHLQVSTLPCLLPPSSYTIYINKLFP